MKNENLVSGTSRKLHVNRLFTRFSPKKKERCSPCAYGYFIGFTGKSNTPFISPLNTRLSKPKHKIKITTERINTPFHHRYFVEHRSQSLPHSSHSSPFHLFVSRARSKEVGVESACQEFLKRTKAPKPLEIHRRTTESERTHLRVTCNVHLFGRLQYIAHFLLVFFL